MTWLINAAQLDKFRKNQKSIVILDASWHLPQANRDAKKEFLDKHIIDAHFLDLNRFHDPNSDLPNMLIRDENLINEKIGSLGIRDDYKVIFYDNSDLHSACRALWMFRFFGHNPNQLYLLDGGLASWEQYGGKTESGEATTSAKQYTSKPQSSLLRTLTDMKKNFNTPHEQVIDLRHPTRYAGVPDPRPGVRAGHIPGSFSFPYACCFEKDGKFLPLEKLRRTLSDIGVDFSAPIVTTCGSGMTAPILNVALDLMSFSDTALYDGSWSEWGVEKLYPGETSLQERPVITSLDK